MNEEALRNRFKGDLFIEDKDENPQQQNQIPPDIDEAANFIYGLPILKHLRAADNQTMYAHELAKVVTQDIPIPDFKFDFQQYSNVLKSLARAGFIRIVEEDNITGNHIVRLGEIPSK